MQSAYFTLFIQIPLKTERNDLIWPSSWSFFGNKMKNHCLAKCIATTSHFLLLHGERTTKSWDKGSQKWVQFPLKKCHI